MPIAKEDTLYHALFLAQHWSKCEVQDGLVYILLELHVPSHHIGYHYLKTAILLFYADPVHALLTGLYQLVGQTLETAVTYQQMEQSMRTAIAQAYKNSDPKIWGLYFSMHGKHKTKRPSNYEFITQIANFLELWQACCKEVSYEI